MPTSHSPFTCVTSKPMPMNPSNKQFDRTARRVTKLVPLTLAVVGLAVAPINTARATGVPQVDQQLIAMEAAGVAVDYSQSWGQTFTVGLPGVLTRIDLQLGRDAGANQPLQVELRRTVGGLPDLMPEALLFSTSLDPSAVPILITTSSFTVSIDLSPAPPTVTPGDQLIILLTSASDHWYLWTTGYWPGDMYPNGSAVKRGYPDYSNWVVQDGWDSGFRTWVTVPEPTALLPIGLLLLALQRRRRRRLK
jgi:hypothetical protein